MLVPRKWWSETTHTLEPQDPGWWYTVSEEVRFQECGTCSKRMGDDLGKETRTVHSTELEYKDYIALNAGGKHTT